MQQLRYYLFIVFFYSMNVSGQQTVVRLNIGKILYDRIYETGHKHINELEKLHRQGVVFVKFDVVDGTIENVKFSSENPKELVSFIKTCFIDLPIIAENKKRMEQYSFILPIMYDYTTLTKPKATDLLEQIPSIDVDSLPPLVKKNDFEVFTGLSLKDNSVNALACYFLPWIKLTRRKD